MKPGFTYILLCGDGSYYTGSTVDLERRIQQHKDGEGANHTRKNPPVELVYYEDYSLVSQAFYLEKQIQKWSRRKKDALINRNKVDLKRFSECGNDTHFRNK
jgi:putative endonuclease